ncbi:MAG: DUF1080 domain-containing protein [Verrucomicrobiota bacterium]
MKIPTICFSLCLGVGAICSVFAKPSCCSSTAEHQSLFNGDSLDGWKIMEVPADNKYYATEENFFVKGGALHCFQTGPERKGGLLLSEKKFRDFELLIDIKSDWGCDSGIFLRCTDDGRGIQVLNDYLEDGSIGFPFGQGTGAYISRPIRLYGEPNVSEANDVIARDIYDAVEVDGLLYAIDAEGWNQAWKHGEWNTLKVVCVGPEPFITTWINGVKVMEFDGSLYRGRQLRDEIQQDWDKPSAWDSEKVQKITGGSGSIALQVHPGGRWQPGGSAMYKNIFIKDLTPQN